MAIDKQNPVDGYSEPVYALTTRTVRPGHEERFALELHRFIQRSLHVEGQLGVHVIRPVPDSGSREYGILRRFADERSRERFYASTVFQEWENTAAALTEGEPVRQELSGLETWFTLPGQRAMIPPPRWKMAIVTVAAVWPVSMLVSWMFRPFLGGLPALLKALIMASGIVVLLTWAVMPLFVRILEPWLDGLKRGDKRIWRL